jgi:hypothetical protein
MAASRPLDPSQLAVAPEIGRAETLFRLAASGEGG